MSSPQTTTLRNGIKVPSLGLGTSYRFGKKNPTDDDTFIASVKHALKVGYRHLDTAQRYDNEHLIGKALEESEIPREELFITSKVYPTFMGYNLTLQEFEKSCKRLNTDYLDLYLIHFPGLPPPTRAGANAKPVDPEKAKKLRIDTWRALEKLYNDGKCRAIGVSNFMTRHLDDLCEANMSVPMVNQCEFHVYYNNKEIYDECKKREIQFQGYCPLGKGHVLTDPVIVELATKYSKTPSQIAIRWSLQNDVITIPGSTNLQRIEENFNVFDFKLSDDEMRLLWTLDKNKKCSWDPTNVV